MANERIVLSTTMMVKPTNAVPLPSFLLPSSKRRQLIMTDLPRLLAVKDDTETGEPKIKTEFEFLSHPIPGRMRAVASNQSGRMEKEESSINYILEVQEKGSKVFVLQTVSLAEEQGVVQEDCVVANTQATQAFTCTSDTGDIRAAWMHTLRRVV